MKKDKDEGLPEVVMPACSPQRVLEGQVALVTGGSSGIGRGIAFAMAEAGARVVVNYIGDAGPAEEVVREVEAKGGEALAHEADVSDEEAVAGLFRRTVDAWGALDILVNNAGIQRDADLDEMTLAQWQQVIDVNLTGGFLCAREAVRLFKRQGVRAEVSCAAGKIVFISSVHEIIPWAGHANYAASKGGTMLLMKSLAQEVARHRVRVVGIAPGAIQTAINREAWSTPEAHEELLELIPYGRIGQVEDIARTAVWLASDHADYVTGASIVVDGGMTLYPGFAEGGG